MKRQGQILLATFALLAAAGGCETSIDPDSETNWLKRCRTDGDCSDGAQCLCGVCTIECDGEGTCASGPRGTSCLSSTTVGCTQVNEILLCVAPCALSSDCANGQTCEDGICVSPRDIGWNPTGTCTAPDDGSRRGGEKESESDLWIPDCNNILSREYWRVFVRESGTAYIVPSPEGPPQYYSAACGQPSDPLSEIVMRYSFCDLTNPDAVELISNMDLDDALAIAHSFHQQLNFSPFISPTAFMEDIVAACALGNDEDSPEFATLCERERVRYASGAGTSADATYQGQEAADLAYHLNELYGISAERTTLAIDPELCGLPADTSSCSSTESRYFYNPATANCELFAFGSCGAAISDFASLEACEGACAGRANVCQLCDAFGCTVECSGCPMVLSEAVGTCTDVGLSCNYGPACGGTECQCTADVSGGATWMCATRAC